MKCKATLALAGVMLVCATTVAWAAKPELTGQEKKAMAEKVKAHHKNAAPQPKTMAQGKATQFRTPSGAVGYLVPTDLWSTLHAQTDANGNVRIVEGEGDAVPPATTEGLPNE